MRGVEGSGGVGELDKDVALSGHGLVSVVASLQRVSRVGATGRASHSPRTNTYACTQLATCRPAVLVS